MRLTLRAHPVQQHSTESWTNFPRKSHFPLALVAALILVVHTALLVYSGWVHSPTLNEPAHLVAGISHWQTGRFDLYRVNPPLVRMVAAVPAVILGAEWNSGKVEGRPWRRSEFHVGSDFIHAHGSASFRLMTFGRWSTIPMSVLGAVVCCRWSYRCWGWRASLAALVLWCFSPTVLGHGALITPDVHASALGVAAGFAFWQWLRRSNWQNALMSGIVLGVAELAKSTLLLFSVAWPLIWFARRVADRNPMPWRHGFEQVIMLAVQIACSLLIVNTGFGFEATFRRLGDFRFVSQSLSGIDRSSRENGSSGPKVGNRFAGTWLEHAPIPLPANYLRGIDLQRADFESFSRPSYLCGTFRDRGWWYFYAYALVVKVPIGVWILTFVSIGLSVHRVIGRRGTMQCPLRSANPSCNWSDQFVILMPAVLVFFVASSQTGFSHHMRYVLPAFPFVFIWISQAAEVLGQRRFSDATAEASVGHDSAVRGCTGRVAYGKRVANRRVATEYVAERNRIKAAGQVVPAMVLISLSWFVLSSLFTYPHSLSYFNELGGGPRRGDHHLINSNIDWGQDLWYLAAWLKRRGDGEPIQLAYYGGFDPSAGGLRFTLPTRSRNSMDSPVERREARTRWVAVSVNFERGFPYRLFDGTMQRSYAPSGYYRGLQTRKPVGMAGYSIRIYRIEALDDIN